MEITPIELDEAYRGHLRAIEEVAPLLRKYGELVQDEKVEEAGRMLYARLDWYRQYLGGGGVFRDPTKPGMKKGFADLNRIFVFTTHRTDTACERLGLREYPFGIRDFRDARRHGWLDDVCAAVLVETKRVDRLRDFLAEKLQELQNQ